MRSRLFVLLTLGCGLFGVMSPSHAAAVAEPGFLSFRVAAQAPAWQMTYDFTSAPFHPLAEGDLTYSLVTMDPSLSTATASLAWPGSAGANIGSLLGVLGAPTIAALNDPIKAQVGSGQGAQESTLTGPTGTTMSASVKPPAPGRQRATAETSAARGALGPAGSMGASLSQSTITLDDATGKLTATATSSATSLDLGVVKIGSVTSSAKAESVSGASPTLSGSAVFQDFQVAGQQAYVDGSGVHLGAPGKPVSPATLDMVNKALTQSGMSIYSTAPQKLIIGGVSYYYAASVMLYWVVPQDSNGDSFTVSLGGAAIAMQVSPGAPPADIAPGDSGGGASLGGDSSAGGTLTGGGSTGGGLGPIPRSHAPGRLSLPTTGSPTGPGASPAATPQQEAIRAAPASTRHGIGMAWFVLLGIGILLGAVVLTRAPVMLAASAALACEREGHSPDVARRD